MTASLRTPFCDLLGIDYPIVLAGMSVGGTQETAPAPIGLVAAVSNAGGLGVLGNSFRTPEELDDGIREVKRLTGGRPYGVDFLLPVSREEVGVRSRAELRSWLEREYPKHVAFVRELMREHDLPEVEPAGEQPMSTERIDRQIEVILDNHVPVFAAALGDPAIMVERAHAQGMKVLGMVGAVRHAERQVAAGVDIITAQGTEAGGHTGDIATFPLVPQVVDRVRPRPVLAAGGIGSGRHVAAALALGAQGAWVGTAFLVAEECNIPDAHKDQILEGGSDSFTLSKFGTGKQQRSYRNVVKEAWEKTGMQPLQMPLQGMVMEPFNASARRLGRWDLVGNPSGQIGGMLTQRRPAKEILEGMVDEAVETIERLRSFTLTPHLR